MLSRQHTSRRVYKANTAGIRRSFPIPQVASQQASRQTGEQSTLKTLRNLWPYIWPSERADLKRRVLIAMVAMALAKVVTVLVPYLYKWAVDALDVDVDANPNELALVVSVATPVVIIVAYAMGRIMVIGLNEFRNALFASVGQYAVRRLAHRTFVHMHELSLRFHVSRRTGGLSRIIERGTKGIETIVRFTILNSIPTIIEFSLMALIFVWYFGWRYLFVLIAMITLYVWFTVVASNWRIGIRRAMNTSDTEANSKAIDSLLNFETVKYFGNEAMEARRFDTSMAAYENAATRSWTSLAWLNVGQTVIFTAGMALCMIFAARSVLARELTLGDFVMLNALLMQLYQPLNFIGFVYREIRQGLTDIETMFALLDERPEIRDAENAQPLSVTQGAICFKDVHFCYDPDREILKGVSFEVPAGHKVAIVGPSGAGKSTISRILFRFYDIAGGLVTIDGQDIRQVTQKSLRAAIGMVPQDTVLFNDTIAYNIRYGRTDATPEAVAEAAALAQINTFIERLPGGYETLVGERGLKLSGGEKQRVAIARTILKGPPILVLDEATSALDSFTEQEIQQALDAVSRDRTTLVIAHRLSTVIAADKIIVLSDGQIVEEGTHTALLEKDGLYAGMWNRQREAEEAREKLREAKDYLPAAALKAIDGPLY